MRFQRPINSLKEDFRALGLLREEKKAAAPAPSKAVEPKAPETAAPAKISEERKEKISKLIAERVERRKQMRAHMKDRMAQKRSRIARRGKTEDVETPNADKATRIAEQIKDLRVALGEIPGEKSGELIKAFENVSRLSKVLGEKFKEIQTESDEMKKKDDDKPAEKKAEDDEKKADAEKKPEEKKEADEPESKEKKSDDEAPKAESDDDDEKKKSEPVKSEDEDEKEKKEPVVVAAACESTETPPKATVADYIAEMDFVTDRADKIVDAMKKEKLSAEDAQAILKDLVSYLGGVAQDYSELLKYKAAGEGAGYSEVK